MTIKSPIILQPCLQLLLEDANLLVSRDKQDQLMSHEQASMESLCSLIAHLACDETRELLIDLIFEAIQVLSVAFTLVHFIAQDKWSLFPELAKHSEWRQMHLIMTMAN